MLFVKYISIFVVLVSSLGVAIGQSIPLYQVERRAEHYQLYRTPEELQKSLSGIPNLSMNFRHVLVNESNRSITYGSFEMDLPEGLSKKQFARLIDWNWKRLYQNWRGSRQVREFDKIELKGLDSLTQEEVDFNLEREKQIFAAHKAQSEQENSKATHIHHKRRSGLPSILSFSKIESDGEGALWIVFGKESDEARFAILNKSISSWDLEDGHVVSYQYAFENPEEDSRESRGP